MHYDYDKFFEDKLKFIAENSHSILDVGGGHPFQKIMGRNKNILDGKDYKTLDIDEASKPDIVGDAHDMPIEDNSLDAVLHVYVFEHLHSPHLAAKEIHRVLKPGGYMLGIVPFIHPYHARKNGYRDYLRFSKDGLEVLFKDFKEIELFKIGRYFRAAIGFLPFLWRFRKSLEAIAYVLDRLFIKDSRNTTAGYIIFGKK
ncbi:MAG: class I SAM-dependent methyltransferase [bacterium]|nr:class I SAM-dependent methyltransferase [bacterium]